MSLAPAISVLLPVRNGADTLARAVASVRQQTTSDWELVIVDDGSTDATGELLMRLAAEEPRLRVVTQAAAGIVAALNRALEISRGEFIARMDADDDCHPERLEAQAALLRADNGLGLASCLVGFGGDRDRSAGYALHVDWINSVVTPDEIVRNRFVESPLAHPSVMFRRELAARHGAYRTGDFPEDYELWLRWLDAGVRMAKVPRELLQWHDRATRLSRTDPRYDPEAFFRIKAVYLAREWERRVRPELWVWGAGRPTRKRAAHLLAEGVTITGYIDVDRKKAGRTVGGRPVILPESLPRPGGILVFGYVSTRGAREFIRGELTRRGYVEGRDFLCCA